MDKKLTCDDYYDSGTVYEEDYTFAQIINDLRNKGYTRKQAKEIFKALCKELTEDYLLPNLDD